MILELSENLHSVFNVNFMLNIIHKLKLAVSRQSQQGKWTAESRGGHGARQRNMGETHGG